MKPIHLLAGLFGGLMILLDLVVVTGFQSAYDTSLMFYAGLAFGQLALLAFWCALARGAWIARLTMTLVAAGCLSQPLGQVTGGSWPQWFTLFCVFAACTAIVTLPGRLIRIRLGITDRSRSADCSTSKRRRSQFSLGGLLSVMTLVGLALGVSRHFVFPKEQALAVAGYGLWLVLIALVTLWALASRHFLGSRLLGLTSLCLVAGWFMARTEYQQTAWFFTCVAFVEAIIICAGIAVIQMGRSATTQA